MEMTVIIDQLASLVTLTILEIVLGIDNLVFVALASSRLAPEQQAKARVFGLMFAAVTRIALLGSVFWLTSFTQPLFTLWQHSVSGRDIILAAGGLFLLYVGSTEIYSELEEEPSDPSFKQYSSLTLTIIQIGLLDIVFSFDSVLTAIGLTRHFWVMALAICLAILVMILAAGKLSAFLQRHPSVKMLALSFVLMVGTVLIADALHLHVPRGYLYFAMGFSLMVELLNIKLRGKNTRVTAAKTH